MALNMRQVEFLTELRNFARELEKCFLKANCLEKCYDEEFADGLDNALLDQNAELIQGYAFDSSDVKDAINHPVHNLIEYWIGNSVPTYEYGQWLRRIK